MKRALLLFFAFLLVVAVLCSLVLWLIRPSPELLERRELHHKYFLRRQEVRATMASWRQWCINSYDDQSRPTEIFGECAPTGMQEVDWEDWGEPISHERVVRRLVPKYVESVPAYDFLGGEYEFRLKDKVLAIRSPGCDLTFQGPLYKRQHARMEACELDYVVVGGSTIQWIYIPAEGPDEVDL